MILKKDKLTGLLGKLAAESTVYVPSMRDEVSCFAPYQEGESVEFGGAKTDISPKETLFPQTETLYTYYTLGEDLTIEETVNQTNQILFGVRSCDSYGIERLDEVFLTRTFVDTPYYERRKNTLIVALGCTAPERNCFCTSFGIDPHAASGADIQLLDVGDAYTVEALTEKGQKALGAWDEFCEDVDAEAPAAIKCSLTIDTSDIKGSLEKMFDDPYWESLSMKCIGCGTCAFVCPTCHCFDISQSNQGNKGFRFRAWDSCTFPDYTLMAGNHNPRPNKKNRLRNRFMHKLSFFEDRYGSSMCCGCGRCIEMCPVGIDISRVIEDAKEVSSHA